MTNLIRVFSWCIVGVTFVTFIAISCNVVISAQTSITLFILLGGSMTLDILTDKKRMHLHGSL